VKYSPDIYHLDAGLAVTGRIWDSGQKVLQSSFETGSSSSPRWYPIFFLIVFLDEALIRNVKIILYINCININININDNIEVINPLNAELNPIC
jgi:hypothetical protein